MPPRDSLHGTLHRSPPLPLPASPLPRSTRLPPRSKPRERRNAEAQVRQPHACELLTVFCCVCVVTWTGVGRLTVDVREPSPQITSKSPMKGSSSRKSSNHVKKTKSHKKEKKEKKSKKKHKKHKKEKKHDSSDESGDSSASEGDPLYKSASGLDMMSPKSPKSPKELSVKELKKAKKQWEKQYSGGLGSYTPSPKTLAGWYRKHSGVEDGFSLVGETPSTHKKDSRPRSASPRPHPAISPRNSPMLAPRHHGAEHPPSIAIH